VSGPRIFVMSSFLESGHREIKDLVDQLQQKPGRLENLGDAFSLGSGRRRGGGLHQLREAEDLLIPSLRSPEWLRRP